MPRPGPRPYECVRRAWHSDRHQPIRGSLIQEIFRVVNEIHSQSTKKNKEWQEKLPVVVLKAEEIMYSKANSEAEYMDLETLLDRINDAINTIIRLDESTETGEFLQPCIEAALHLGCTPRKHSRSQRNVNPRYYLDPNSEEPFQANISQNQIFPKPPTVPVRNRSNRFYTNNGLVRHKFPFVLDSSNPFAKCPASNYAVYPLYHSIKVPPKPDSKTYLKRSVPIADTMKNLDQTCIDYMKDDMNCGCDLSLRLGPFEDAGSNTRKRNKPSTLKPFSRNNGSNDPLFSVSSQWVSNNGDLNPDPGMSKKLETFDQSMDGLRFSSRTRLSYGQI